MEGGGRLYYAAAEGSWLLEAPCEECAGFVLDLRVSDPTEMSTAQARADSYLRHVHRIACAGCESLERLKSEPPTGEGVEVWWDAASGEWLGSTIVDGTSVCLPLGVRTYWARREAEAAGSMLLERGVPLRVAAHPAECDPDAYTIFYDVPAGRWALRTACPDCGGCDIRLIARGRGAVARACEQAQGCIERIAATECPNCRTLRERSIERDPDGPPALWFDTVLAGWVAWMPVEDGGVTMPVGLTRFDVNERQLLLAASGLQL